MDGLKVVSVSAAVDCSLTAEQWDLYTTTKNCGDAAFEINREVCKCARECPNKQSFLTAMFRVLAKYSDYGAYDSEPCWVLRCVAAEIYGGSPDD